MRWDFAVRDLITIGATGILCNAPAPPACPRDPLMRNRLTWLPALGLILLAVVATGCARKQPEPEAAPAAAAAPQADAAAGHLPPGIDWFDGDVDAAFAAAKSAGKPIFLYWGAEWCPPCAQIKSTIFNRREFQERSRLFVPVYLDGDTPSAQRHGERFGVIGYPTMILFRPDGTEITRLPGSVDMQRYATILDVALADAKPVAEILRSAASGGVVTSNDWRLLAYYSWPTDNGRVLPAGERLQTFRRLHDRCPPELEPECGRLYFEYLGAAADQTADGKAALDGLERADGRRQLLTLLGSTAAARANVDNLLYAPKDVIGLLSDAGTPERRQLTDAWRAALGRLTTGPDASALSGPEQLNTVRAKMLLARLDAPDADLPPELVEEARQNVARVDAATTDAYARQAAINAAAGLYWEAGLDEDANRLLVAELEKSKSPYYFMLDLADLAEKAGREDEAVEWLARAYAGAQGPATRFQWGYSYLVGLLEMTPEDTARIERVGLEVLGELDGSPDAFYQRTRMRLEQLSTKLLEWGQAPERASVVDKLRGRTAEICGGMPAGDEGRANCEAFLKPAAPTTAGG
jgi:thiol-disulfide isomerase/thioredoxin